MFRVWQQPQPAKMIIYEHWLSMAISNNDLLHGLLHQISWSNVISSYFLIWVIFLQTWPKPIMEDFCRMQKIDQA